MSETSLLNYGIITTDENLHIKIWNPWIAKYSGMSANQVVGNHLSEVVPDSHWIKIIPRVNNTLQNGTVEVLSSIFHKYLIDCKLTDTDGKQKSMPQHVVVAPLKKELEIYGLFIIIQDARRFNGSVKNVGREINLRNIGNINANIRKQESLNIAQNADPSELVQLIKLIKSQHQNLNVLNSILMVLSIADVEIEGALLNLLDDDDTDLKIYVIQALGDQQSPEVIPTLMQYLHDQDQNIRYHAIEALGKLQAEEAVKELCKIALEEDFFMSFPAIDALANIGLKSVIKDLIPLLEKELYQETVSNLIGLLGDDISVVYLIDRINESPESVTPLVDAIMEIYHRYENLLNEGIRIKEVVQNKITNKGIKAMINELSKADNRNSINLIRLLSFIEKPEVCDSLTKMLGNPELQCEIIEAVVRYGTEISKLLVEHLESDEIETRKAAAIALGRIGDSDAITALISVLGKYDDSLSVLVIGSLAKIGAVEAFLPLLTFLDNKNASIRRASIAALNSIGHPDMGQKMEVLLRDGNDLEKESAIQIAGYFGYRNCKVLVEKLVTSSNLKLACLALESLPFYEDDNICSKIVAIYKQSNDRLRISAVKAARFIDSKDVCSLFQKSLLDKNAWVRYYTIRSLNQLNDRSFSSQLIQMAHKDPADQVRLSAIEAIGNLRIAEAEPIFSDLVKDENDDIVVASLFTLGELEIPSTFYLIEDLLIHPNSRIAAEAIKALSHFQMDKVADRLYRLALSYHEKELKEISIEALGNLSLESAIKYLLQLSTHKEISECCYKSLLRLKSFAIPIIEDIFNQSSLTVQRNIIQYLTYTKQTKATHCLIRILENGNEEIKILCLEALYNIGSMEAEEIFEQYMIHDPSIRVRSRSKELLKKF